MLLRLSSLTHKIYFDEKRNPGFSAEEVDAYIEFHCIGEKFFSPVRFLCNLGNDFIVKIHGITADLSHQYDGVMQIIPNGPLNLNGASNEMRVSSLLPSRIYRAWKWAGKRSLF